MKIAPALSALLLLQISAELVVIDLVVYLFASSVIHCRAILDLSSKPSCTTRMNVVPIVRPRLAPDASSQTQVAMY